MRAWNGSLLAAGCAGWMLVRPGELFQSTPSWSWWLGESGPLSLSNYVEWSVIRNIRNNPASQIPVQIAMERITGGRYLVHVDSRRFEAGARCVSTTGSNQPGVPKVFNHGTAPVATSTLKPTRKLRLDASLFVHPSRANGLFGRTSLPGPRCDDEPSIPILPPASIEHFNRCKRTCNTCSCAILFRSIFFYSWFYLYSYFTPRLLLCGVVLW